MNMRRFLALSALAAALGLCGPARAAVEAADEYEIKAAMYVNLLRLVEWPAAKKSDTAAAFVIGVADSDDMALALEKLAHSGTAPAAGKMTVKRLPGSAGCGECQSVFVGGGDRKRIQATLLALSGAPILTVGENDRFLMLGGMIDLNLRDDKVQIEVNLDVAQEAGLTISSRLLKIAVVNKALVNKAKSK